MNTCILVIGICHRLFGIQNIGDNMDLIVKNMVWLILQILIGTYMYIYISGLETEKQLKIIEAIQQTEFKKQMSHEFNEIF